MMLNPILRRETQTSLRSWKIFAVITIYVSFIAAISFMFVDFSVRDSIYSGFDPQTVVYLYALLSGLQFGLILITVPALTAGSISGERERQTIDLLLITKMTPFSIVLGKLISGIGIMLLMLVATMPIYAMLFYFGGVSIVYLLGMTGFMIITAFMIGSISIYFSTVFKKTMISMVTVYLILGFLVFGTYISYFIYIGVYLQGIRQLYDFNLVGYIYAFLSVNPGAGFFSLIDTQLGTQFFEELTTIRWNNQFMPIRMWIVNSVIDIGIGLVFLKMAAAKINPLKK